MLILLIQRKICSVRKSKFRTWSLCMLQHVQVPAIFYPVFLVTETEGHIKRLHKQFYGIKVSIRLYPTWSLIEWPTLTFFSSWKTGGLRSLRDSTSAKLILLNFGLYLVIWGRRKLIIHICLVFSICLLELVDQNWPFETRTILILLLVIKDICEW